MQFAFVYGVCSTHTGEEGRRGGGGTASGSIEKGGGDKESEGGLAASSRRNRTPWPCCLALLYTVQYCIQKSPTEKEFLFLVRLASCI